MKNYSNFQIFLVLVLLISSSIKTSAQKLYAVSGASGAASYLYELNSCTGDTIRTIGYTGYSHMVGLAVHPKTGNMYGHVNGVGSWGNGLLVEINKITGTATAIGSTGIQSPDLAFDTAGTLYAWFEYNGATGDYDNIGTINLSTGAFTQVNSTSMNTWRTGISFNSDNECYMKDGDDIYPFNHTNGTKSSSGVLLGGSAQNLLAFDKNDVCYTGVRSGSSFILKTLNVSTGALTNVGTAPVSGIAAIAFDPTQNSGVAPTVSVSVTNPSSGQSNGSIATTVCGDDNGIRYARWGKKGGFDYPEGTELNLSNADAGDYTLMLITTDHNIHYFGPYSLTN